MDDASVSIFPEVKEAIHARGACLMHAAPYSSDLNLTKNFFSVCKAMSKRNKELDWTIRHCLEMNAVTPFIAYRECKKCGIPLCGVKVEDDNDNDVLIGACFATAILVKDNFM